MPALKQVTGSISPGSAGFSIDGGRMTDYFTQAAPTGDEIEETIVAILGYCQRTGTGGLNRTLPMRHPQYPWMFAERISDLRGEGVFTLTAAQDVASPEGSLYVTQWAKYPLYRYTIEFTPRMYPVLPDTDIKPRTVNWKPPTTSAADITVYPEWKRFCDVEVLPAPEFISAQQGQMFFRTGDSAAPHNYSTHNHPRILLPKGSLKLKWYQVPYSYVESTNSYLISQLTTVNQESFRGYSAGHLLYVGLIAKRYTPPVPPATQLGQEAYSYFKLCDLELLLAYRRTTQSNVPTPTNANWIAGGHNLQPWLGTGGAGRGFYYLTDGNDASANTLWHPTFESSIFDRLFTDPDAA